MSRRIGFVTPHARQRARERIPSLAYVPDHRIPGPLVAAWYDGTTVLRNPNHEWRLCRFRKKKGAKSKGAKASAAVLVARPAKEKNRWALVTVLSTDQAWEDIESGERPKLARLMGV